MNLPGRSGWATAISQATLRRHVFSMIHPNAGSKTGKRKVVRMNKVKRFAFVFLPLFLLAACGPNGARLQKSVIPPDKTLYESGQEYLKRSQYIKARLAWQTLISTYSESELSSDALFAIADSYYDEGGMENLLQAEDQFKNFVVFFPTDPKVPDAMMKVIALNRKMMSSPDRDPSYAYKSEAAIQKLIQEFPDSDFVAIAREYLKEVQDVLARGNLDVAQFYVLRGNVQGAESRYREIIEQYKNYSRLDAVYYGLADVLEKANRPGEASEYYGLIAKGYPDGRYFDRARSRLTSLGEPIPPIDQQLAAEHQQRDGEGFHPLSPLIHLALTVRGRDSGDYYLRAKKSISDRQAAEQQDGAATDGDILIQTTLTKDASVKTNSSSVVGTSRGAKAASDDNSGGGQPNKKKKS